MPNEKQNKMKILLIEDDPGTLEVIRFCLEVYIPDATVIATTLGMEGLRVFRHASPDLMILDLDLPDASGIRILESIRKTSDTPVIIVTKTADDEEIEQVMKLEAIEDIIEPFDPMDLLMRINKLLKERNIQPKIRLLPDQQKANITR
ncbi:response regulator transcription factor [Chloroflexota bacterium]